MTIFSSIWREKLIIFITCCIIHRCFPQVSKQLCINSCEKLNVIYNIYQIKINCLKLYCYKYIHCEEVLIFLDIPFFLSILSFILVKCFYFHD